MQSEPRQSEGELPLLKGFRILEVGHFVAAPFCTRLLADLGADVIKIEPPGGDPVRQWGEMVDGNSLWWSMHGRNKRSVTIDLKSPKGPELLLALAAQCDAVVENMRPGQIDRLGIGPKELRQANPDLVICHISGYGQTGPGRDRAAFGLIGEAVGGLRHLTNHAPGVTDLPPVRVGVSIGDSVSGIYAALGIVSALLSRERGRGRNGLTVDVALSESVLSLMEGMLPEYGYLDKIKQPTGGAISTAAPTNAYPSRDGKWVLIGANSDPLFARLAKLMERPDFLKNPDYKGNALRVIHHAALDQIIGEWSRGFDGADLIEMLEGVGIPCSTAYTAEDIARDEQYLARRMILEVEDPLFSRPIMHTGIVPHVPEAPGTVRWAGPAIGAHTEEVLQELLGISSSAIENFQRESAA